MKIAIAQVDTQAGDFAGVAERIVAYSQQASAQGIDLLVFGSCALTGPEPVPFVEQQGLLMDLSETMVELAGRVACPTLVPVVTTVNEDALPEALLLSGSDALPLRFATYVRGVAEGADANGAGGDAGVEAWDIPTFELGDCRFAVAFDYDDLDDLCDYDYGEDVIVYLPCFGYAADDPSSVLGAALTEGRYLDDALATRSWIVAAGAVGCYDRQVFTGGSFVLAPWGELAASAPSFEEAWVTAEVGPGIEQPLSAPLEPEVYSRPFFCWEALATGLRGFAHKLGYQDVALALNGTLGSTALATLASDALGPTHVHVLMAPPLAGSLAGEKGAAAGRHTADSTCPSPWHQAVSAAARTGACRQLAENLHVNAYERDARLVGALAVAVDDARSSEARALAAQLDADVAQAELRGLARQTGSLLLGAQDKTWLALEAGTGAGSVGGAGGISGAGGVGGLVGADLLPFGDLYRTDLLELARTRNTISPVIPDLGLAACDEVPLRIANEDSARAFAELDAEARLSAVDMVLALHIEWDRTVSEIVASQGDEGLVAAVLAQMDACELGRAGAGTALQVSSRMLWEVRRPLGLAWHDRARSEDELPTQADMETAFRQYGAGDDDGTADGLDALDGAVGRSSTARRGAAGYDTTGGRGTTGGHDTTGGHGGFHGTAHISTRGGHATSEEEANRELSELLGYLRDLSGEMGNSPDGSDGGMGQDGMGFGGFTSFGGSPFSEN